MMWICDVNLSIHLHVYALTYHLPNIIIKNVLKRIIITSANDDAKMLKFNINLIINRFYNIIGVNGSFKKLI